MAKREFLMLAHKMKDGAYIAGSFASEKLDGQRAFWDGGISRGILASQVGWANTERDGRYVTAPVCTGLWSRNGKVIHAPDWWLDYLPPGTCLDGELYTDRGLFQSLRSIISTLTPGPGWESVVYKVFDLPAYSSVFSDGEIRTTFFKKKLKGLVVPKDEQVEFWVAYGRLLKLANHIIQPVFQTELPSRNVDACIVLEGLLDTVTRSGGEGVMLRTRNSLWTPERSHNLLKVKKLNDAEGIVVGYRAGRESDNSRTVSGDANSKLLGKMGTLIVLWGDVQFELCGFTDSERELSDPGWAVEHPGEVCPEWVTNASFLIGSHVTFRYREVTDDGKPKEARFWRRAT